MVKPFSPFTSHPSWPTQRTTTVASRSTRRARRHTKSFLVHEKAFLRVLRGCECLRGLGRRREPRRSLRDRHAGHEDIENFFSFMRRRFFVCFVGANAFVVLADAANHDGRYAIHTKIGRHCESPARGVGVLRRARASGSPA